MAREAAVVVRYRQRGWGSKLMLAGAGFVLSFLSGCAGTVDTLTSQRFRESPFKTMFRSDDPMWVLENVPEGDERARAMYAIKEPKRNGRSEEEQTRVIQLIAANATADKQVVCRLSAIEALARFEDPRAGSILVTAYHNAGLEAPGDRPATEAGVVQAGRKVKQPFAPVSSFTPDQVAMIQCRALEGLGKKRTPEALALLCEVAVKPAKKETKPTDFDSLARADLGQDSFDMRLAAIRALGEYKGEMRAAQVLYQIVNAEREEIAPRSRAYESLQKVTGKDYPPKSPDWKLVVQIKETAPTATGKE